MYKSKVNYRAKKLSREQKNYISRIKETIKQPFSYIPSRKSLYGRLSNYGSTKKITIFDNLKILAEVESFQPRIIKDNRN